MCNGSALKLRAMVGRAVARTVPSNCSMNMALATISRTVCGLACRSILLDASMYCTIRRGRTLPTPDGAAMLGRTRAEEARRDTSHGPADRDPGHRHHHCGAGPVLHSDTWRHGRGRDQ